MCEQPKRKVRDRRVRTWSGWVQLPLPWPHERHERLSTASWLRENKCQRGGERDGVKRYVGTVEECSHLPEFRKILVLSRN